MSALLDSILLPSVAIFIVVITAFVTYFKYYAFQYWEKRGIPYITPSIPTGNMGNALIGKENISEVVADLYKKFKSKGHQHAGFYFMYSPVYMPLDPDIIKHILIKDFQHFVDRGVYHNEEREPLTAHLFAIEGEKWRNLRSKLSPTFTSGKMKMMFQTLVDCSDGLKEVCDEAAKKQKCLDIKDILARFTTDIIGSCAFGIECNSLKNPDAEFRKMGRRIFEPSTWEATKFFIANGSPGLARLMRIQLFDKNASDFFMNAVRQTMDYRKKNNVKRNDFLQLLIQLKNQGRLDGENPSEKSSGAGINLTFNEAAAQAFVFFLAGFETSSTTMTFCLFELAQNLDIQSKVRHEVQKILKEDNGKITYEGIMKMTYMEKVVQETLRKYPPVSFLKRKCNADRYKVPGTDLVLEKGQDIFIPVYGIQRDPEYFPNPEVFDPERFNDENKAARHPCLHLPFGDGPRNCIGLRFGMMQTKVGLAVLLSRYQITINNKTPLPITIDPHGLVLSAKGGIFLNFKNI